MEKVFKEKNSELNPAPDLSELRIVDVGIGEMKVTRDPRAVLVVYGVGSCVSVCAYDPEVPVAGMAHILLPKSGADDTGRDARYADVAIPALVGKMEKKGADGRSLVFKIAGGASLVRTNSEEKQKIGARNVREVQRILGEMNARVASKDVGGNRVRTVRFFVSTGEMVVSNAKRAGEQAKT
ncbi:MAG: chemotaxis protein CheD [bacterium]